jgi:hypothetical protein
MSIGIWARYRNNAPEKIDTASNESSALYLLGEYRLAYGANPGQPHANDWKLWIGRRKDEPKGDES